MNQLGTGLAYIACIRERKSDAATVGYAKLVDVLGIDRTAISAAISLLIAHHLVTARNNKMAISIDHLYEGNLPDEVYDSANTYILRGLSRLPPAERQSD